MKKRFPVALPELTPEIPHSNPLTTLPRVQPVIQSVNTPGWRDVSHDIFIHYYFTGIFNRVYPHVEQPCHSEGCGVAVMARLLHKKYDETLAFAREKGFCDKQKRVNLSQMKRFLTFLGQESVAYKKHDGVSVLPKNCICHGRWGDMRKGARHWIAFYDGQYFDPLSPQPLAHMPKGFYVTQTFSHP